MAFLSMDSWVALYLTQMCIMLLLDDGIEEIHERLHLSMNPNKVFHALTAN